MENLSFFSFDSGLSIGMERMFSGFANKVYQGAGPILIKFKDIKQSVDDKENRIYLNVDGEYYQLEHPIELKIRKSKKFVEGQIKFLAKNLNK